MSYLCRGHAYDRRQLEDLSSSSYPLEEEDCGNPEKEFAKRDDGFILFHKLYGIS